MFENLFTSETTGIAIGLLIPVIGTTIGAATVFLLRKGSSALTQKLMLGFAAGVMLAAVIWSLMLPSIELSEKQGALPWLSPSIGFLIGIGFLLMIDTLTPHIHISSNEVEGLPSNLKKTAMLIFAITIHHIPEGMAIGVVLAGATAGNAIVTVSAAMTLSIGIAMQNIPEGAVVSVPLKSLGKSKMSSFLYGSATGLVQPISALITILLIDKLPMNIFPAILAFAAGAMMYVIVEEI
ncbi:MAG: ZIP family metal transporter, partial [Bacteroidales bacterium]